MNQNFSDQDIINKDILEILNLKNLPNNKKQEFYQKMTETIQNRVMAKILDGLNENEKEEFTKLLDENDKQKIEEFLKSHGVDTAKLMLEESVIYKTEMVGLQGQIKPKGE